MGRKLRIDFDGACHHIVVKGINNSYIFDDDYAKQKYLSLIDLYKEKHDIKLFAYCIMDNHAHLLIQSGQAKSNKRPCISDFMHDLQAAYARWYNKNYAHSGPVFNRRFDSFNCLSIPYFVYIINYIHNNPVKHGKTKTVHYRYSSMYDYMTDSGRCDLADCYKFLGMPRTELLLHLNVKSDETFPFLIQLLEKIKLNEDNMALQTLLLELSFKFEDIRGARLTHYFERVQREIINELINLGAMPVRAISKLLGVSNSYIYKKRRIA